MTTELAFVAPEAIPREPGVLEVSCPTGPNTFRVITVLDCLNLRDTVASESIRWASDCEGYLQYRIAVVHRDSDRRALYEKVRARHSAGT